MNIIDPKIADYLARIQPPDDPVIEEMERVAREREFPIVGPQVGRLCFLMVKLTGAKRIFEMGSGFGYSAYWMASALPDDGRIICTEGSEQNIELARQYFGKTQLARKLEFHCGDAIDLIGKFQESFDLILNDVDKVMYPKALAALLPRLRPGGLLISDNLLWHGRVLDEQPDAETRAIMEYTRILYSETFCTSLIPLRDGVGLSLKL